MRAPFTVTRIAAFSMLLAGSAFVPPAMAQKGNMLSPVSPWSVSRIEGASAGGKPYCAMARRYTKDLILTMAQNPAREASLALDFQSTSFHAQQLFSLVLDPGAGQERKYQMRPTSENAFVVRLGDDPAFFDALKTTGFLRVGVDNKQYHFDIGDIDEGKAKLDNCLAYLKADPVYGIAAYGSEDKGWTAAASPQKYEQALAELRSHISRLQNEKQELESSLVSKRDDLQAQQGLSAGDPVEEMEALTREVETLSRQNEQFMLQMADAGTDAAAPVIEPGVSAVVDDVSEQSLPDLPPAAPVPAAAPPPPPPADVQKLGSDMTALQAKNKALIDHIEKLRDQTKAEYDKLLEEQVKENEALKVALAAGEGQQDEAAVIKMQEAIITLERQKEELGAKMQTLGSAHAEMGAALQGAQTDESTLRAKNAELRQTLLHVGAELSPELKAEPPVTAQVPSAPAPELKPAVPVKMAVKDAPAAAAVPVPDVQAQVDNQPMEITQTVGNEEIALRNNDQLRMLEAKLSALEIVNKDLHETLDQATKRADAYEKEIKDKEVAFAAMQAENAVLRQQLSQVQSGGENAEKIAALVAENKELKDHVRLLSDDLIQIRAQLAGFEDRMAPPSAAQTAARVGSAASETADAAAKMAAEAVRATESAAPVQQAVRSQPAPVFSDAEFDTAAQKYEAELAYAINQKGVSAPAEAVKEAPAVVEATAPAVVNTPVEREVVSDEVAGEKPAEKTQNVLNIAKKNDVAVSAEEKELQAAQQAAQKAASAFAGQSYHFTPDFDIQHLLNEAHVTLPEYVKKVDTTGDKNTLAYRWQSQGVFGSAELKPIVSKMQFDDFVYEYLNITQERCDGEFAVVPERTLENGGLRLDSYEIACIGGRVDSTASLLFFSKDDTFSVLAQEAPMEQMPLVMEARDRLIKTLSKSNT